MGIFHALLCCCTLVGLQGTSTTGAQLIEPMPMVALLPILKEIGCEPTLDSYGGLSKLTKGTLSVDTSTWTMGTGKANEEVVGINLYRRYSTHRTLDGSLVYDWMYSRGGRESNLLLVQQLDRSVWADKTIMLGQGLTKARLAYELDHLWVALASVEKELLGPGWRALDPSAFWTLPPPTDLTAKVFHLSNHDIAYLIRSWGWTYKGGYGSTGATVQTPAVIDGVTYWFCRPHPGYPVWDHLMVTTSFAMPETDNLQGWMDKVNAKLKGAKVDGYPGGAEMLIVLDLDLAPGMTLAHLKASIERYAKQAAPFVRGKLP